MSNNKDHNSPLNDPSLKKSVFQVPMDYFDQLEGKLMDRLNAEEGELANAEHLKENIFKTPQGYFEQLENKITQKLGESEIRLDQNDQLKQPVFEAPEGYFETLESRINSRLDQPEEVKVIPLYQKNWFRLAIAAVLVLGLFLGLRNISFESQTVDPLPIADVESDLILDYLIAEEDYDYELMAMSDDFEGIINDILLDETFGIGFELPTDLELEYDFEYFEQ